MQGILSEGDLYGYAILKRVSELGVMEPHAELEAHIDRWRGYVQRRQAISAADVDELEDHLRGQIADSQATGFDDEEAFLVAIKWSWSSRQSSASPDQHKGSRQTSLDSRFPDDPCLTPRYPVDGAARIKKTRVLAFDGAQNG